MSAAIRARVPRPGLTALDYGAGPEHVGLRLADAFGHLTLADRDPRVAEVARTHAAGTANAAMVHLDLAREAVPDVRFDVVITSMAWHHLEAPGFTGLGGLDRQATTDLLTAHGYRVGSVDDIWRGARRTSAGVIPVSVFLLTAAVPGTS